MQLAWQQTAIGISLPHYYFLPFGLAFTTTHAYLLLPVPATSIPSCLSFHYMAPFTGSLSSSQPAYLYHLLLFCLPGFASFHLLKTSPASPLSGRHILLPPTWDDALPGAMTILSRHNMQHTLARLPASLQSREEGQLAWQNTPLTFCRSRLNLTHASCARALRDTRACAGAVKARAPRHDAASSAAWHYLSTTMPHARHTRTCAAAPAPRGTALPIRHPSLP